MHTSEIHHVVLDIMQITVLTLNIMVDGMEDGYGQANIIYRPINPFNPENIEAAMKGGRRRFSRRTIVKALLGLLAFVPAARALARWDLSAAPPPPPTPGPAALEGPPPLPSPSPEVFQEATARLLERVAGGRVVEIRPDALRVETEAGPVTLHLHPQTER